MSKPLYFNYNYDEICRTEEGWRIIYEDYPGETIKLTEAVLDVSSGYSWCDSFNATISAGDCGKICPNYAPINGKRGKCKHKLGCYESKLDEHGKPITKTITI